MNPYSPTSTVQVASKRRPSWLLRAFFLNAILLGIPGVVLVAIEWGAVLFSGWRDDSITGNPVTFQHFVWFEVPSWAAVVYFLIPNAIFAVAYAAWGNPEEESEGTVDQGSARS